MTVEDIQHIERELAVTLPSAYRETVVPFPIPALRGNTDSELWDDPIRLIALNRELRAGDKWRKPWPEHLFAVGELDGESYVAIDLRNAEAATLWVDHGHLDAKGTGQTHGRFEEWATAYLSDLREDLLGDGHNPDATRNELNASITQQYRQSFWGYILVAVFLITMLLWLWSR